VKINIDIRPIVTISVGHPDGVTLERLNIWQLKKLVKSNID